MSGYTLLKNCDIYTPSRFIENGCILIAGERIVRNGLLEELEVPRGTKVFNFRDHIAVPGFIDIHLHGGGGRDFMGATAEEIAEALRVHLRNGTTSVLPTLLTDSHERMLSTIKTLLEVQKKAEDIPEIIGLNLEGPYISREKSGAQLTKYIRRPSLPELKEYIETSEGKVKILTVAPEIEGAPAVIRFLTEKGVIPSAGHTNATFEQMEKAIKSGIRLGVHLFNAMRGIAHREPGAAGALLLNDEVYVEVVADGVHLHPSILRLITRVKPAGKIILVTDATRFYGFRKGPTYNRAGRLFGSNTPLWFALSNMIQYTEMSFRQLVKTVTSNPARLLGIQARKGCLRRRSDADIVLLDRELKVKHVFIRGKKVHLAPGSSRPPA